MVNQINYSWESLTKDIKKISNEILKEIWFPDYIVGIKRGGLVPAIMLSHSLKVPLEVITCKLRDELEEFDLSFIKKNLDKKILLVDDICDSGKTFKKIFKEVKNIKLKTCVMFYNTSQSIKIDFKARNLDRNLDKRWIIFPWDGNR